MALLTMEINISVAERTLEDHEDILAVHRELERFASRYERKFYFSEDFQKFELFVNPKVRITHSFVISLKTTWLIPYTIKEPKKASLSSKKILFSINK